MSSPKPVPGRELALVIPAEDVADECKAVLDEAPEVVGRHGLAARHAVEVGRLEAHELDRVRLEQLLDRVAVERCAHGRRRWDGGSTGRDYAMALPRDQASQRARLAATNASSESSGYCR